MFLQQQALPVVHTVGGRSGGEEGKGGREREKEKGRGRGGGEGGEREGRGKGGGGGRREGGGEGGREGKRGINMIQKTSGPSSSPPFQLHIMCPKP